MKKIILMWMSLLIVFHVRFADATDMEDMECYKYSAFFCNSLQGSLITETFLPNESRIVVGFYCQLPNHLYRQSMGACYFNIADIGGPPEQPSDPKECAATRSGSIVQLDNQVVGEKVPIIGTDFEMYYYSNRVIGKKSDYQAIYNVTGNAPMDNTDYALLITVLSDVYSYSYNNLPNRKHPFEWNGMINGVETIGSVPIKGASIAVGATRPVPNEYLGFIGNYKAKRMGMGAWTPSIMHFYDHYRKKLYRGDGSTSELKATEVISQSEWRVVERDGSLVHTFDSAGRHLRTQLGLTGTVIYQMSYNSQGYLTQIQATHGRVVQFVRNSNGELTKIVGFKGEETLIELDANGYLSKITNPQNESYEMTYSSQGLLQTFQKPTGAINTFIYDIKGNLTKDQMPGGAFWNLVKGYQGAKPYSEITSALGAKTRVEIWDRNNVFQRKTIHPNGVEELDIYDKDTMRNQGAGAVRSTSFIDDPRFGSGVQYISSQTLHTKITNTQKNFILSDLSNPFSIQSGTITTTVGSNVFQTLYDGSLKKYTTTSPMGRIRSNKIDNYERVIETQVGSDYPIYSNYTNEKLTSVQQGSRNQSFQYNSVTDLLDSVTNALNQTTIYVYDSAQRLRTVILPDLRQVQYNYNSIGQVTSISPANGKVHTFNYGINEKNSHYIPPYLANNTATQTQYSYDLDNRLTQIARPNGQQINYNYNPSTALLSSISTPQGSYQQYFTPSQNNYTTFIAPSGLMTFHNYSGGLLSSETIMGASAPDTALYLTRNSDFSTSQDHVYVSSSGANSLINYTYDNDALLTQAGDLTITRDSQTPRINSTAIGQVEDFYTYNSFGEVIGYEAKFNNAPVYQLSLTRDLLGRVLTKTETMNSVTKVWSYTYDVTGRLTHVSLNGTPRSTYNYDANSNRTSGNINGVQFNTTIDDQDRMTQFGLNDYTYNLNGEMTEKINTLTQVSRSFTYDVFGNTISTTKNSDTKDYIFDSFHRRTLKKVNGTLQEKYVYLDQLRLGAVITATGQIAQRFVYGTKSHVPDYFIAGTEKYRIISDNLGSPRLVIRVSDGQVMQRMNHDEFGRVIEDSNPGFTPFGFAGGLYDAETGLVRFGAREYDAEIGRWLSKDPILFAGGDTNLFGYVANDPVNWVDPSGLRPGDQFPSMGEAAGDVLNYINPTSISQNREYGGYIVKNPNGTYSATNPLRGGPAGVNIGPVPAGGAASYHTHGGYDPRYDNENFSPADIWGDAMSGIPGFLGTPGGAFMMNNAGRVKRGLTCQ